MSEDNAFKWKIRYEPLEHGFRIPERETEQFTEIFETSSDFVQACLRFQHLDENKNKRIVDMSPIFGQRDFDKAVWGAREFSDRADVGKNFDFDVLKDYYAVTSGVPKIPTPATYPSPAASVFDAAPIFGFSQSDASGEEARDEWVVETMLSGRRVSWIADGRADPFDVYCAFEAAKREDEEFVRILPAEKSEHYGDMLRDVAKFYGWLFMRQEGRTSGPVFHKVAFDVLPGNWRHTSLPSSRSVGQLSDLMAVPAFYTCYPPAKFKKALADGLFFKTDFIGQLFARKGAVPTPDGYAVGYAARDGFTVLFQDDGKPVFATFANARPIMGKHGIRRIEIDVYVQFAIDEGPYDRTAQGCWSLASEALAWLVLQYRGELMAAYAWEEALKNMPSGAISDD